MRVSQPFLRTWEICSICNQNGEEGFNRNARAIQELPQAMCVPTQPGHTPESTNIHRNQRTCGKEF